MVSDSLVQFIAWIFFPFFSYGSVPPREKRGSRSPFGSSTAICSFLSANVCRRSKLLPVDRFKESL